MHHPHRLSLLFHRRWAVPILGELHRDRGAKLITLVHRLGASHGAVKPTLDHLAALGWVRRNPGAGHPLRPEYVPTAEGDRLGAACVRLLGALPDPTVRSVALRKWSMPVLHTIGAAPARFVEIRERLGALTDRALALALRDLRGVALVGREVIDAGPPSTLYSATGRGLALVPYLADL